jgi:hypothetical protein
MNLNEEYLPYKHIIGQVILDVSDFRSDVIYLLTSTGTLEKQTFADGC